MIDKIKDIGFHLIMPNFCFWHGKDIELGDLTLPKRYSGELAMMIDLLFYGYIITAITSWYHPYITEHSRFYFMFVFAFYTGSTIIPWFYNVIKKDIKIDKVD